MGDRGVSSAGWLGVASLSSYLKKTGAMFVASVRGAVVVPLPLSLPLCALFGAVAVLPQFCV